MSLTVVDSSIILDFDLRSQLSSDTCWVYRVNRMYCIVYYFNSFTTTYNNNINRTIARPIQKGLNTHHQDQSITLHNFKIIKVNPSKAGNPIPVEVDDFEFDMK